MRTQKELEILAKEYAGISIEKDIDEDEVEDRPIDWYEVSI